MKETVNFPVLPELSSIDFTCSTEIRGLVGERLRYLFGPQDDAYVGTYMDAIEDLFAGRHPGYQAMDTAYHDITHTLQATLCLVEILQNRQLTPDTVRIAHRDFKRTLVAILFHDMGYLKTLGDTGGTGAKYTHLHEKRSCNMARDFLASHGWKENDIRFVENLISATGPLADLTHIPFRTPVERAMGQVVCTADYIGQMSDPAYPDKLVVLFREFEESYRYQNIPHSEWPFSSYENLLRATPNFWGKFVQYKMNVECDGMWRYLEHPFTGENPYIESVHRNLAEIDRRIARLDGQE